MSVHIAWMDKALCRDQPEMFFTDQTGRGARIAADKARAICEQCPVKADCETHAKGERYGVWAGRLMSSRMKRPRVLPPINHGTNGGYRSHQRRKDLPCEACREAHRLYNMDRHAKRHA